MFKTFPKWNVLKIATCNVFWVNRSQRLYFEPLWLYTKLKFLFVSLCFLIVFLVKICIKTIPPIIINTGCFNSFLTKSKTNLWIQIFKKYLQQLFHLVLLYCKIENFLCTFLSFKINFWYNTRFWDFWRYETLTLKV